MKTVNSLTGILKTQVSQAVLSIRTWLEFKKELCPVSKKTIENFYTVSQKKIASDLVSISAESLLFMMCVEPCLITHTHAFGPFPPEQVGKLLRQVWAFRLCGPFRLFSGRWKPGASRWGWGGIRWLHSRRLQPARPLVWRGARTLADLSTVWLLL